MPKKTIVDEDAKESNKGRRCKKRRRIFPKTEAQKEESEKKNNS